MKVKARRRALLQNIPVQIRMPPPLYDELSKARPKGWSLQRLIVAVLKKVSEDETLVLEIEK